MQIYCETFVVVMVMMLYSPLHLLMKECTTEHMNDSVSEGGQCRYHVPDSQGCLCGTGLFNGIHLVSS
jgi:hypothetical protein